MITEVGKRIITTLLIILPIFTAYSSELVWDEKNDKMIMIKTGSVIIDGEFGFNLAITTSNSISPEITAGMGLSWERSNYNSFISLLFSARYNSAVDRESPFICGEIGYAIERVKGKSTSISNGPMIGAGIGIIAPVRKWLDIFLELSYKSQWTRRYISNYYSKSKSVRLNMFRINAGVAF